jgi:NAD/NADP transhydrogenase beta subunit
MKKAVWIAFGIALVLVNLFAWLAEQFSGLHIPMILRLALVLGITMGSIVFSGAFALINKLDEERPLTGHVNDSLQKPPPEARNNPAAENSSADR